MTESEKPEFTILIGAMFESFGQESTRPRLLGYWIALQDLSIASLRTAVADALRKKDRLPAASELRTLAGELTGDQESLMAWADVQKAMPLGSYRHIDFENRFINATIRQLGGWPAMFERCGTTESEKWYRIEFLRAYQSLSQSRVDGEICKPLAGMSQVQVIDGVVCASVPTRIGCRSTQKMIGSTNTSEPLLRLRSVYES